MFILFKNIYLKKIKKPKIIRCFNQNTLRTPKTWKIHTSPISHSWHISYLINFPPFSSFDRQRRLPSIVPTTFVDCPRHRQCALLSIALRRSLVGFVSSLIYSLIYLSILSFIFFCFPSLSGFWACCSMGP